MSIDQLEQLLEFPHVRVVFAALEKAGGQSRFVGGCVRDALAGKKFDDVDIATDLLPLQIQLALNNANIKNLPLGIEHGTITAFIGQHHYEITTLRKDISTDGRRAVVAFTKDWQIDAYRRDFTINAMSYCPVNKQLYDYATGVKDLTNGVIRFIGDPKQRVKEDFLRILRYFRFLAYYGRAEIDQYSLQACQKYAAHLLDLSGERKFKELDKILQAPGFLRILELMANSDIVRNLFVCVRKDFFEVLEFLSKWESNSSQKLNSLIKLFAISDNTKELAKEYHLSNKQAKYLGILEELVVKIGKEDLLGLVFDFGKEIIIDALVFHFANYSKSYKDALKQVALVQKMNIKKLPISGQDVIDHLNVEQGTEIGELLGLARTYWLESKFSISKSDLINLLKTRIVY